MPSDAPHGQATTGCSACAHPWSVHDRIAAQYCLATTAGPGNRACVCTVRPSSGRHARASQYHY